MLHADTTARAVSIETARGYTGARPPPCATKQQWTTRPGGFRAIGRFDGPGLKTACAPPCSPTRPTCLACPTPSTRRSVHFSSFVPPNLGQTLKIRVQGD